MNPHVLKALEIANRLDWSLLNCHDRALALASSVYNESFIWNFLTCHYSGTSELKNFKSNNYYGSACYDYIAELSGLRFERRVVPRNELINGLISCQLPCVLIINNFYRKGSKHFYKKSHPHFVFVYETNADARRIKILDELMEKQSWRPENFKDGVEYEPQELSFDDAMELTKETDKFADEIGFDVKADGSAYAYYYAVEKIGDAKSSPDKILLSVYKSMIESWDSHLKYIQNQLECFSSKIEERYSDFPDIDSEYLANLNANDPTGIKAKLYFPYEWQLVEFHYRFLKRIYVCEEHFLNIERENLPSLINRYDLIKTQLSLFIMKRNYTAINSLIIKFITLYNDEISYLMQYERK